MVMTRGKRVRNFNPINACSRGKVEVSAQSDFSIIRSVGREEDQLDDDRLVILDTS